MKLKKRTRNIILIVVAAVLMLGYAQYLLTMIFDKAFQGHREIFQPDLLPTYFLSSTDSDLISPRYRRKMEVIEVCNSRYHSPVSFVHIQKAFCLAIHKVDIGRDGPMDSMLHQKKAYFDEGGGSIYSIYSGAHTYTFDCVSEKTKPISMFVFASDAGQVTKGVSNDSIVNWRFVCNRFFIHNDKDGTADIKIETKEGPLGMERPIAMDLLFLKRDGGVYLLLLTADDPKTPAPPGMLYDIVEGK
jgi:hypothetical protein